MDINIDIILADLKDDKVPRTQKNLDKLNDILKGWPRLRSVTSNQKQALPHLDWSMGSKVQNNHQKAVIANLTL